MVETKTVKKTVGKPAVKKKDVASEPVDNFESDIEKLKKEALERRKKNKTANLNGSAKRLPEVKIPGCETYWAKDTLGNIERLEAMGYFIVPNQRPVLIKEVSQEGKQLKHVLMAIDKSAHKERFAEKQKPVDDSERQIKSGVFKNENAQTGDSYIPEGLPISIEQKNN